MLVAEIIMRSDWLSELLILSRRSSSQQLPSVSYASGWLYLELQGNR